MLFLEIQMYYLGKLRERFFGFFYGLDPNLKKKDKHYGLYFLSLRAFNNFKSISIISYFILLISSQRQALHMINF